MSKKKNKNKNVKEIKEYENKEAILEDKKNNEKAIEEKVTEEKVAEDKDKKMKENSEKNIEKEKAEKDIKKGDEGKIENAEETKKENVKEEKTEEKAEENQKDEIKEAKENVKVEIKEEEIVGEDLSLKFNKNTAVFGKNYKDSENFFMKTIINYKAHYENKDKVIAIIDNDFKYIDSFTVEESLDYILEILSVNFGKIVDDVDSVMDFMDLESVRKTKLKKLSPFTIRKINIASSVILKPEILFVYLDLNLDKEEREDELKCLRKLSKKFNFKLVYLTNNKDEILNDEEVIEVE